MKVTIAGAAATKFGELWNVSPQALAREAVIGAIADAGIEAQKVEALYVGNMLSGMLGGQEHLGAWLAEACGLRVPALKVEGACASGGLALFTAAQSILSGQYQTVVVLGIEKMTDYKAEAVAAALMGAGSEEERLAGATFPGLYAMLARIHMAEFGTTREQLAAVAVKNHYHASLNPKAQFKNILTVEQVLKSSKIADPLTLLDCSPISDGAAAVVLSATPGGVVIRASAIATDTLGLAQRSNLTELKAVKDAAGRAFQIAGITAQEIDVAEVHDCFSIAEVLALEDLGFFKKGEAAGAIERGEVTLGTAKKLVVNTSGGLKGCGHPVGATGVKQIVELTQQLRGSAGARQVPGARFGLAQNVGGSGATAVVHILERL